MSSGMTSTQNLLISRLKWSEIETESKVNNHILTLKGGKCLTDGPGAALAEYIGDSRAATANQRSVNSELLDAQTSARRKEIITWLAPVAYDVEYFSNDLASARALRHPKTCMWILQKTEVTQLLDNSCGPEKTLLWIYAIPGAGKTVLSSFLIDHFQSAQSDPVKGNVLYFFCKNTDVDKNTPTVVVRSLLYQLYNSVKDQKANQSLDHDIGVALDRSGQPKAVNFTVLWQLFSTHVMSLIPKAPNGPDQWSRGLDWSKWTMDQWSTVRPEAGLVRTSSLWFGLLVQSF